MNADQARAAIRARPDLHAFISLTEERGEGTIVGVKDLVDVAGTVTTAGAIILPPTPAAADAPVIAAMRGAGCVVAGKTNLHEWAFGVTNINPHHGTVANPRAPGRVSGGSSGGSAAAVAAGLVDWALGSDTGGSVRIPAALCGVVGFKPTLGTFDMEGVVPLSHSLDTLGPLAPDVDSAIRAFAQMRGRDEPEPLPARALADLRLAVVEGWAEDLDPPSAAAWARMTEGLPAIPLPSRADLNGAGFTMLLVEAGARHRRWVEAMPERYGADVLDLLRRGLETPRAEYVAALDAQARLRVEVARAMGQAGLDALLVPATRIVAPPVGATFRRADLTIYTRPFNTTGHPAVCLPVPDTELPVGIQLVGHHGRDLELLAVARAVEAAWRA